MVVSLRRKVEHQTVDGRERKVFWLPLRYYIALVIFAVGALYFYLRLRLKIAGTPTEVRTSIARNEIAIGSALLFRVLRSMQLLEVTPFSEEVIQEVQKGHQVIVANHPSILDALLLLSKIPNGFCIMKRTLLKVPVISGFAKCAGYVPYSDPSELLSAAVSTIRGGGTLIVFPEGTRSSVGGISPLHRGAARIAIEAQVPLSVCGVFMEPVVLGRGLPWWRAPSEKVMCTISKLETISPGTVSTLSPDGIRNRSIELTKNVEDTLHAWFRDRCSKDRFESFS
jgi:1-acyl-sn-glycerol-3-phosphate acyltransferase